jgi:hypothetical protein
VTELGAGWREDPYGRHELRFHDGTRWTPYVRDGEDHAVDEPVGAVGAAVAPSPLLGAAELVLEAYDGTRRERDLRAPEGTVLGRLRPAQGAQKSGLRALVAAKEEHRSDALALVDAHERLLATLLRPISDPKGTLVVRDGDGQDLGRISQRTLLGPASVRVGELRPLEDGTVSAVDAQGTEVATMTGDGAGRVARLAQPIAEPLRTLLVAALATYEG